MLVLAVAGIAAGMFAGAAPGRAAPARAGSCAPEGGLSFVCGVKQPEDLVGLPGSDKLITGAFGGGGIFVLDARTLALSRLYPDAAVRQDKAAYPACPGPPDPAKFSAHGLSVRTLGPGKARLYVVHHGERESIEVFDLATAKTPRLTWIGCVVAPSDASLNAVVSLPSGEILATSITNKPAGFPDMLAGRPTGELYDWKPGAAGFATVAHTHLSGDNGVEVSGDGRIVYLAATGTRDLYLFDRLDPAKAPTVVKLGFQPDNIRWIPDGRLMIAGQGEAPPCGKPAGQCPPSYVVSTVDPKTLKVTRVAAGPPVADFYGVSVAFPAGGRLWLGSHEGDRIAYRPQP